MNGHRRREIWMGLRGICALACCLCLCARPAVAAPAVVGPGGARARTVPLDSAPVVSNLVPGYPVCVVDGLKQPGWQALRLPGYGGIGYVRDEDVQSASLSPTMARLCGGQRFAPASMGGVTRPSTPAADPGRPLAAGHFMPLVPFRLLIGIGSGAAWLNRAVAGQYHIGSAGVTFNVTVGFSFFDLVAISGSGGALFPADHASFNQDVVPLFGGGDPTNARSSLEVQSYSVAVGLRTPFFALNPSRTGALAAALSLDRVWATIHGIRAIDNCGDCRSERLPFTDTAFWRVGAEVGPVSSSPSLGLLFGVAYQRSSVSDGISQELRIGFTCWLL